MLTLFDSTLFDSILCNWSEWLRSMYIDGQSPSSYIETKRSTTYYFDNLYNLIARISLSKLLLYNRVFLLYLLVLLSIAYKLLVEL